MKASILFAAALTVESTFALGAPVLFCNAAGFEGPSFRVDEDHNRICYGSGAQPTDMFCANANAVEMGITAKRTGNSQFDSESVRYTEFFAEKGEDFVSIRVYDPLVDFHGFLLQHSDIISNKYPRHLVTDPNAIMQDRDGACMNPDNN